MKNTLFSFSSLTLATLLLAGCESNGVSNRIQEKSAIFHTLTTEQKKSIEDGIVMPGYTTDMAYMALGKPTSVETKQKDDTKLILWSYKKFYPSGKMADILTAYSRARNPNLLRSNSVESGTITVSDHAPGTNPAGRSSGTGAGVGTAGTMDPLSLPDIPVYNLYVFFQDSQVVDIKIESLDGTKF